MRSPQLGQKIVSFKWLPLASLASNGYHLTPMDARAWMVRLALGVGLALAVAGPAGAQTPTPTPTATPTGAPKILLAFDASGSMLTDDGNGTRKIDAAKDAAVALLDTLPDSTEIGLRVYGGTLPSRPIGPACRDSKLVLPMGRVDRNRAQAEQQIRSFRGRGRTPIAYALEQAANDLGDSGSSRTIVLVSDGKDTCQPPSPCSVAQRVAKGGVEMRIQAIGFNVDPEARAELECIASAGGGVYRDATDAAEPARGAAGAHHPRAAPVRAQGQADQGRPERPPGDADHPGPVHGPDAAGHRALVRVELKRGETLKASQSFIPPDRNVETGGASSHLGHRHAQLRHPGRAELLRRQRHAVRAARVRRRESASSRDRSASASRPPRTRRSPSPAATTSSSRSRTARDKALFNATGGQPYTSEMSVEVLGRGREREAAADQRSDAEAVDTPDEPPSAPLLAGVGGGLAAAGFAGGALIAVEATRMRRVALACAALLTAPAAAHAQQATPVVGGGSFNTAPMLKTGRYADTVAAGETVYWKVEHAQGPGAARRAPRSTPRRSRPTSPPTTTSPGLDNLDYDLDLFSPLREPLSDEYDWRATPRSSSRATTAAGAKTGEAVSAARARLRADPGHATSTSTSSRLPASGTSRSAPPTPRPSRPRSRPSCRSSSRSRVEGDGAGVLGRTSPPSSPGPTPEPTATAVGPPEALLAGDADAGDPALTIALVGVLALLGGLGLGALAARAAGAR